MDAVLVEVKHYYENNTYNEAVIQRIKEQMTDAAYNDFDLIFSAHGLPQKIVDAGDPYQRQIERHVELLKRKLQEHKMDFHRVHLAYQSKVGPLKWLEPSLETALQKVRNRGVIIYPIAFTVDNSETDYELAIEYRELAEAMGFKEYKVCRCVNDSSKFVEALEEIYTKMK
jgi:ferrochelatase